MSVAPEPMRGLPRIVFKIRTEGVGWIAKRFAAEAVQPTTLPGQILHTLARRGVGAAASLPRRWRRSMNPESGRDRDALFAFYDLKVAPITFDFLWFLVGADLQRRRSGLKTVHVVVVPGPHNGVRQEQESYEAAVDEQERRNRIRNILAQARPLLSSCGGMTIARSREEAAELRSTVAYHVYPAGYEPALPVHPTSRECLDAARRGEGPVAVLRATPEMLDQADRWIAAHAGGRRLVTITLRNYGFMTIRNSNSEAWAAFARSLDSERYLPVIFPDFEETIKGLPAVYDGLISLPEAVRSLGFRMALYERAFLNLGVNTGPMGLCWLNSRTRYATFKMAPPGVPQTTVEFFRMMGFEPGQSLPFATLTQRLVWTDDDFDRIDAVFKELVPQIESATEPAAPEASLSQGRA